MTGAFSREAFYDALVAYWHVMQVTIMVVAVLIFLSSLDDLFVDLLYWRQAIGRALSRPWRRPPEQARLEAHPEKNIAVMTPAWREAEVIAAMLANTLNAFDYGRFHIFVGVYANDPDTIREVDRVRARFPNVHRIDVLETGPTSKADCLNWIVRGIHAHEARTGEPFDVFLLHDAEDVVHPFGLRAANWFIEGHGMLQLPVLSMNRRWWRLVAGHYMDEFAEFHGKDLPVRSEHARVTPSAGVATAISREAMDALCAADGERPFNTASLTEDYDVGYRLRALGFASTFVRYRAKVARWRKAWFRPGQVQVTRRELVATREFFPDRWGPSVRQKARWMLGISYLGWRQLGWFGDLANRYFLFRDRKTLFTAPTGALAYLIVLQAFGYWGVTLVFPQAAVLPPLIEQAWVWWLVNVNFLFLVNRLLHRAWFTGKTHGLGHVPLTPLRVVVANLIGFAAFARSMRLFLKHLITRKPIAWDKTQHAFPALAELRHRSARLGDVLRHWNHVGLPELDAALAAQKARYRPIGLLLVDRGAVDDEHLAEAFAERGETYAVQVDPFRLPHAALAALTPVQAARFGAIPVAAADGRLDVALAEPLDRADRTELEGIVARAGYRDVRWLYAPLSDVAFAVRYAWAPQDWDRARAQVQAMRGLALINGADQVKLWRSIRRDYVRLGDLLVRAGAVEHRALTAALRQRPADRPSGEWLVARGLISAAQVEAALARQRLDPDLPARAVALGLIDRDQLAGLRERGPELV